MTDIKKRFKENDSVRILCSKDENIKQGDIGVVIMVFYKPNLAYEIEVVDEKGNTKAIDTFFEDEIELL